jgi:osmotically-inducible protein OsmY
MLQRRSVLAAVCGFMLQCAAFADSPNPVQGSDAEITDRVVQKLLQVDADVARRISVTTLNGVVTLEGTVFTANQIFKLLGDTGKVAGVVQVKNRLHVQM